MSLMAFIEKGSTKTAFIRGIPMLHENVRIEFDLVPPIDHTVVESEVADTYADGKRTAADRMIAEVIAARLKRWTFLDDEGKEVGKAPDITPENILRCRGPLQHRLILIVYKQNSGGDPDPFLKTTDTRSGKQTIEDDLKN